MSGVVPKMDTESLALFQKHGFVPGRRTLLRNIYKLCQGEYIEVSPVGCQIKKRNLRFDGFYIRENFHDQEIEIIDSCFEKLAPAYKLGLPLSSGFDSNLLLERLVKYSSSFNVLTIGDKSHMDETSKVEEICNQLNVKNLNKRIVTHKTLLNYKDIVERLEGAVFEPGIFLQYELAKMSADLNIECLVCGDGADQVFNKNFFEKEDSISEYKFGKNPFELASSLIIKKVVLF